MVRATNVHSLTDFVRNSKNFVELLSAEKHPLGLTVNGKVRLIVLDPELFEEMEQAFERFKFSMAIQEGLADVDAGRVSPLEDALVRLRAKHGL